MDVLHDKRIDQLIHMDEIGFCNTISCDPAPEGLPELDTSRCQGCGCMYENDKIMIVEDVGPMCIKCLHNAAFLLLGSHTWSEVEKEPDFSKELYEIDFTVVS